MTFKENMQSDVDDVLLNLTEFGETVSYTVSGGSPKDIQAVLDRNIAIEIVKRNTGDWKKQIVIMAISRDSTNGIANPGEDDKITFDSKTWDVERILEQDDQFAQLAAIFLEPIEYAAEEYRQEIP